MRVGQTVRVGAHSARAHDADGAYQLDAITAKLGKARRDPGKIALPEDGPRAAVAAVLRPDASGEGTELFFIRRAESPKDPWSGHIAFPGGRRDSGDETLLATAIRETREEVGIDLRTAELLARLPDVPAFLRSKRGALVVAPFVFAMRGEIIATPNHEVADVLWVSLAKLAAGEGKGTHAFTYEDKPYELPCIRLDPGQHVLWGMTHRMLETMLEALA